MADRFYGTVALGGQITQEQYARCLELLDHCLEFEGELEDDGTAAFHECVEEDFAELVQYCVEQKIALMLQWEAKYDIGDYVEYWIDGNYKKFDTDSSGQIVVSILDLLAQSNEFPEMTIKYYVDAMNIPELPELLIGEPNQQAAREPSRTFTSEQKPEGNLDKALDNLNLEIAKDVLEFVCKTISHAETIGSVERHGSRADAIANEAPEIHRRCLEAIEAIKGSLNKESCL